MPQLMNNTNPSPVANQNIDIGAILKTLIDNSSQNQVTSLNSQDSTQQTRTAYQMGIDKALKNLGEQHVMEATQAGIDPQDIANHPVTTGQNDPKQVLAGLISLIQQTKPNSSDTSTEPKILPPTLTSKQGFDANGNLQLGGLFDFTGTPLKNLLMAQQLTGQEPLQKADYQRNKMPLTQEQQANAIAGYNTAQIQSYNDAATRITSQIDSLNKQFAEEQKTITPTMAAGAILTGKPVLTPKMVEIQSAIGKLQNKLNVINSKGPAGLVNPAQSVPTHSKSQINTYNKARASGLSVEEARKKAGL